MAYDETKLTRLAALKALAEKVETVISAVQTKVTALENADFQTGTQVNTAITTAISKTKHASFKEVDSVPEASAAEENILYLVMNSTTNHYDIYAKVGTKVVLLDDTTIDLSDYVQKVSGKGLSTNDYTTADKTKLDGMVIATDAEVTEMINAVFA